MAGRRASSVPADEEPVERRAPTTAGPTEAAAAPAPSSGGGFLAPFPEDVARAPSSLANLTDRPIAVRGAGVGVPEFAAAFLGVAPTETVATTAALRGLDYQLAALALADDLATTPPDAVIGADREEPPEWVRLDLGQVSPRIPLALAAAFAAGRVAPCPLVVSVGDGWERDGRFALTAHTRAADDRPGVGRGRPQRARPLRLARPPARRRALVQPGPLSSGPPGTGKTALCRVVAAELAGRATVVVCAPPAVATSLRELVSLAVLHLATGADDAAAVTTGLLLRLARDAGLGARPGQYP